MPNDLRLRPAVRAVVMDPDRRILLVHFDFETADLPNGLWACPGGGVDPGEAPVDALRRELREEIGLVVAVEEVGDPIWFKEHEFDMAGWDGQADSFYLIEVEAFEPAPLFSQAEMLAEHLDGLRWWTWAELEETSPREPCREQTGAGREQAGAGTEQTGAAREQAGAGTEQNRADLVTVSPRDLFGLLEDLITHGRPPEPRRIDPL